MLQRPSWERGTAIARRQLVQSHHIAGITASGLAASIADTTGESVNRTDIISLYRRYPILEASHPLGGATRIRRNKTVDDDVPNTEPCEVMVVGFTEAEAAAYDAAAPGVTVLKVTDRECRWPISKGLFCGHPAQGRYCEHHTRRAGRSTT